MSAARRSEDDRDRLVRSAVLRHGLPVDAPTEALTEGLTEALAEALTDEELRQRTTLWAAGERIGGLWCELLQHHGVDDPVAATAHRNHQRLTMGCEAIAVQLVELLAPRGIDVRLVKGIAAANLDYDDPSSRSTVDIDALVPRSQLGEVLPLLTAHGYRRVEPALRPGWEQRFARTVLLRSPYGLEIDLHVALATGYFGRRLPMQTVFEGRDTIDLAGVQCGALSPAVRLLMACYASGLNRGTSLRYLRDAAQLLLVRDVDWREAVRLAEAGDGEAVMAAAAVDASRLGVLPPDHPFVQWAGSVRPSATAAKALHLAAAGKSQGWSADARSTMLALGPVDRARFLAEFVVRSPERRRADTRSLRQRLSRVTRFARLAK